MPQPPQNLSVHIIPCLSDNYAYIIRNSDTSETALIDAPEAGPIQAFLDINGWTLTDIVLTHHHNDHIDGVGALRGKARVIGAAADAHRLPPLDLAVSEGDALTVCGLPTQIFDVPGHTIGHVAFYMEGIGAAFTADSLMALGCGRLFEGTPDQMWHSLKKLRALPAETLIYSGHEYTASNAKFALTIEPANETLISRVQTITAARSDNRPTVPSTLAEERATNPFLRADIPDLQSAVGMIGEDPSKVFAHIRQTKDNF